MSPLIEEALALEKKGQDFYEKMAERSVDPLARTLFTNLASDEVEHARWISELDEALGDEPPEDPLTMDRAPIEERIKEVFDGADLPTQTHEGDYVQGLETAMTMETRAIELYRQILQEGEPSEREKTFLEAILREEWDHLEALRNVHAYLTQTGDWFADTEIQRWNWMNV